MTLTHRCPKKNPKLLEMLKDGTIFCYLTHAEVWRCSDVACCEDCKNFQTCPRACSEVTKKDLSKSYVA